MPKFYCEYCSIYLTHSSPAGRKQHSQGRKHINAKVDYYQKLVRERFFQPPQFLSNQIPMFTGLPMMGMMPGFPGLQPGNMVQKLDSNPPFLPPQGTMPPFPGPLPGPVPPPLPGHLLGPPPPSPMSGGVPPPIPGHLPGVPGMPVIPTELPKMPTDLNPLQPLPMPSGQQPQNGLSQH